MGTVQPPEHPEPDCTIDRQSPRQPDQPGPKARAIAQPPEVAMRLDERFLRDVFGVFALPQHAVCHTERKGRRLDEQALEFAVELVCHACQGMSASVVNVFLHRASGANILTSLRKTPPAWRRFSYGRVTFGLEVAWPREKHPVLKKSRAKSDACSAPPRRMPGSGCSSAIRCSRRFIWFAEKRPI